MSDDDDAGAEDRRRFREYECPDCAAFNPVDDGFFEGDEVRCFYCGQAFIAHVRDGKLKLKSA